MLGWQLVRIDQSLAADLRQGDAYLASLVEAAEQPASPCGQARTDAGGLVPLYAVTDSPPLSAEMEAGLLRSMALDREPTRTAPADPAANCHGWVFAGGRFWVVGGDVERILADNAYRATTDPREGDLAVFRDTFGGVTHSGVVRAGAGGVRIESKWGVMGRYVHTPVDHAFRYHGLTYYHSPRGGHLLRGLTRGGPSESAGPPSASQ